MTEHSFAQRSCKCLASREGRGNGFETGSSETARAEFYINENGEFVFRGNAAAIKWLEEQVHMFKGANPHVHAHVDSVGFESVLDNKSLALVFYMEEEL